MAAGGDVQSFKNVPDKDFDHACTPCGVGDTKTEAVKYCAECREYLCIGCSKHHGWQRATHSHNLLDKDAAKKHPVATTPPKCHYHPDRDIDMYCERHEKVCCTRCIDTEHRNCFGVMFIEEMKRAFTNDSQTELLQNKVTKLHDRLSDINKREQEFTDSLECQRRDILQIIQADERGFIEHLTKLKAELTDMLDKKQREFKDEHRSEIRKVTDIIKKLREAKDDLKNISSVREMETTEKCVLLRRVQNTVADAEQFYDEWEFKGKNELRLKKIEGSLFQTNLTLTTCKKMVTLGQICQVVEPRNRMCELKSMENPDLETNIYYINDLCVLQDGTIMLADNANKVHWLDANCRVKDYCNLGASPTSICCIGRNEVAVKLNTQKVQFISAGNCLSRCNSIPVQDNTGGLVQKDDDLWVSTRNGINVYGKTGNLRYSIHEKVPTEIVHLPKAMAVHGEIVMITRYNN